MEQVMMDWDRCPTITACTLLHGLVRHTKDDDDDIDNDCSCSSDMAAC